MSGMKEYLAKIAAAVAAGNATEHTHRPALKALLEEMAPGVVATNEPQRVQCGAPDYILTRGQTPLGYVEAKDVGRSLDEAEGSEQLRRYRESLGNLILTDYLEFRWYVGGEKRLTARLAAVTPKGGLAPVAGGEEALSQLLEAFLSADAPTVGSPKELAERMARMARLTCDLIGRALEGEAAGGALHAQRDGFRETLLHDLSDAQFADMYAQTICYGLFAARCNHPGTGFTREHAAYDLPKTNPFLRRMFGHIAGPELDDRIAWAVDDLAHLLARADMAAILADFGRRTRQEDPVVHFYETFLAAYDPKMREARGVYYTPEPVVSYIVRSVDHVLKTDFGLAEGLADASKVTLPAKAGAAAQSVHRVQILDPATGTGTFLHGVVDRIHETFEGNAGMWSGYVRDHLLPRLFGFELLMAPYAVAHMKLGLQLKETGYDFGTDERLGVYLTNTLEEAATGAHGNLFAQWVVDEANAAGRVKQVAPVMVVLGNPPYSGHSANKGAWMAGLLSRYKEGCPELSKPAQAKWLSDDYVKFIRFAQWRIERTGYGILAFISNHGYLDNPTFRCMRRSLLDTFDDIYILDLHGSSKKKERAADGGKEENVFDIRQGVAIGIFVKRGTGKDCSERVRHSEIWGTREHKYQALWESDVSSTVWTEIAPEGPHYSLAPRNKQLDKEFKLGWPLPAVFSQNGDPAPGIVTTHDEFAISWSAADAVEKVERLLATTSEAEARQLFRLCSQDQWNYDRAKAELADGQWRNAVAELLYRPFDRRWTVLDRNVAVHRRERVMRHMLAGPNLALISARSNKSPTADHFFCSRLVVETKCGESTTQSYTLPLYLYPTGAAKTDLFDEEEATDAPGGRRPNLAPAFTADLGKRLGMAFVADGRGDRTATFGPEDVFAYIYAVFHAPSYRTRYAAFLKVDFPRVPLTSDTELFRRLCGLGDKLVALHLMETTGPALPSYPVAGDNRVEAVRYTEPGVGAGAAAGRVWINGTQYFEGVPPEVWTFQVGGYQVCQKWLKDRKGRLLTYDDLTHYRRTVAALAETRRLMAEVDAVIEAAGGWPMG